MVSIGDAVKKSNDFKDIMNRINSLYERIKDLTYQNERMRALLVDCGYCEDCLWDIESIGDVMVELTEPIWPKDCEPLCVYCMIVFKEMFN